jgi:phage regulator Rha-like protein
MKKQDNKLTVFADEIKIIQINGKPYVSTQELAKRMEIEHKAVVNSINKHADYFQEHGVSPVFKIRAKSKTGQEKEALLSEDQAYLLLTLSRNTDQAVKLKSDLIKVFSILRQKHELFVEKHAKLEYQQNREIGKLHRRNLMDELKPFAEYAKSQGSKGFAFIYINITKLINSVCGVKSIDEADEQQLAKISTAHDITLKIVQQGMKDNTSYKTIKTLINAELKQYSVLIGGNCG